MRRGGRGADFDSSKGFATVGALGGGEGAGLESIGLTTLPRREIFSLPVAGGGGEPVEGGFEADAFPDDVVASVDSMCRSYANNGEVCTTLGVFSMAYDALRGE